MGKGYGRLAAVAALALAGALLAGPVQAGAATTPAVASSSPTSGRAPDPARWVTGSPAPSPAGPVTHAASAAGEQTLNWSGEVATGTTFTGVTGNWAVPAVSPSTATEYSDTWVGIGGGSESSSGLLQVGTEQGSGGSGATYSAWVEMLPARAYTIVDPTTGAPATVVAGDRIQAQIVQKAAGTWMVELTDATQGWRFVNTYHYTGTSQTAEWIEEAPTVATSIARLADFHTVRFTDMQVTAASPPAEQFRPIDMINDAGVVIAAPGTLSPSTTRSVTITDTAPSTPPPAASGSGYDLVGADGGVFVFGGPGGFYGSLPGIGVVPNKPVVGMVPTSDNHGYFLVAADGGVFTFGNAPFLGSLPGIGVVPNSPVVGLAAADTDRGYFLVGRDGGVFTFGTVPYLGSLPAEGISVSDIVGIAATPTGNGYWLIASTGRVYAFGGAHYLGTAAGTGSPVSAIAGTPTGGGYWVTTRDGGVLAFGNARSFGTLPAMHVVPNRPVIGIVHTAGTGGYWLVGSDGGVFTFGDAPFIGALPSVATVDDIVGAVATT